MRDSRTLPETAVRVGGNGQPRRIGGRPDTRVGITKQAASQLIDTLVVRGYVERQDNPDDRGRRTIELTDRGRAAATAVRSGVEAVDAELAQLMSPAGLVGLRAGLEALADIRARTEEGS